jgi:hypothetical protein
MNQHVGALDRLLIIFVALLSCAASLRAQERMFDSLKNAELVELLASRNRPPKMMDQLRYRIAEFPDSYNHEKQRTIFAAAAELRKRGVAAFPELIRFANDQRYSCLRNRGLGCELLTVGDMCWWIIRMQVDAWEYALDIQHGSPPRLATVPFEKRELAKWFESKKGWALNDFQKESLRSRTSEIDASSVYPQAEKNRILQQFDKVNQQLGRPNSFFVVSNGSSENDGELFFDDSKINVTLITSVDVSNERKQ